MCTNFNAIIIPSLTKIESSTLAIQIFLRRQENVDAKKAFLNFCWQNINLHQQKGNLPRQNDFSLSLFSFTV